MYQKVKRIIVRILIISLIVGALLYFIPWPTRVNLTLEASKLDQNGNVVSNTTITIKGVMLDYLFREDSLNVSIYPFDTHKWVKLTHNANTNRDGIIYRHSGDCFEISCYTNDASFCKLLFTKDFKYVAFVADEPGGETNTYYVASANSEVNTEDLIEYFRYLPPFG